MAIIRIDLIILVLIIFLGSPTLQLVEADQGQHPLPASASPPANHLKRGTVEIGVIGGAALPIPLFRARTNRRLTMASLNLGRVMTNQIGQGALAGQFELLLEVTPLMVLRQPESAFGVAASPVFLRWNFAPPGAGRTRVFAEASGGILLTNNDVPARTTSFNFVDQAGFGLRFGNSPDRAWLLGYRFQHISNGGRIKPNPGVNFNFIYAGVIFGR